MAVAFPLIYPRPQPIDIVVYPWAEGLPQTELMTSVMSYHYPPLPPPNEEFDISHPAYAAIYNTPPAHPSQFSTTTIPGTTMTPRDAQLAPGPPFSPPNVGVGPSNLEAQQLVLPDKKRSKLGYHRTTIACGHCRKRKIRCVPIPSDVHGRCINCIRLKKECEFYPVDQPPPSESRPAQLAKISPAPAIAPHPYPKALSKSNSSEVPADHVFNQLGQQVPTSTAPTLKSDNRHLFSIDNKVPLPPSADQPFGFGGPSASDWMSAGTSQSPGPKPADLNPTWRGYPPESPMSAQFSPFGPSPSSSTWTPGSSDAGSREDMPWANFPPVGRSMSYGGEPLASHHSQYSRGPHGRQFDRRASTLSDVYTPSLGVPVPGMEEGVTPGMESAGSLSAGVARPPPFGGWSESQHAPIGTTYTYPIWGHGDNTMGQSGFVETGQLTDNESPQSTYFATR